MRLAKFFRLPMTSTGFAANRQEWRFGNISEAGGFRFASSQISNRMGLETKDVDTLERLD
jgi:hypothetical protein